MFNDEQKEISSTVEQLELRCSSTRRGQASDCSEQRPLAPSLAKQRQLSSLAMLAFHCAKSTPLKRVRYVPRDSLLRPTADVRAVEKGSLR